MNIVNDNLKIDVLAIDIAIRRAFAAEDVAIDDITWNPHRGGLVNNRFSIHSVQVTVGQWQETLYRIDTRDIKDFSAGTARDAINGRIAALVTKYLEYPEARKIALGF